MQIRRLADRTPCNRLTIERALHNVALYRDIRPTESVIAIVHSCLKNTVQEHHSKCNATSKRAVRHAHKYDNWSKLDSLQDRVIES